MKKISSTLLLISAGLILSLSFIRESPAQENLRHVPIEQVLEFTLGQLQESLQTTLQQNEQLTFENTVLRRNIEELQRKQAFLDSGEAPAAHGSYPDYLKSGQESAKFDAQTRVRKTDELIVFFEQALGRLNEKLRIIDNKLDDQSFASGMNVLEQRKGIGEQNIARAERKYNALDEAHKTAVKAIQRLKDENEELARILNEGQPGQ